LRKKFITYMQTFMTICIKIPVICISIKIQERILPVTQKQGSVATCSSVKGFSKKVCGAGYL
jgi:hypothetical protein